VRTARLRHYSQEEGAKGLSHLSEPDSHHIPKEKETGSDFMFALVFPLFHPYPLFKKWIIKQTIQTIDY
jgi:hypothetical protein